MNHAVVFIMITILQRFTLSQLQRSDAACQSHQQQQQQSLTACVCV